MQFISGERASSYGGRSTELVHRDHVPACAPESLGKLYGSLFGILPAIRAIDSKTSQGIFTYVRYDGPTQAGGPDTLLMFRRDDRSVRVLNEGMRLDQPSIDAFCTWIFAAVPEASQIDFHAIAPIARSSIRGAPNNSRRQMSWPCTEDIVIRLPESPEAYLRQLGKATRKSLKKHLSRARRELPGFSHQVISGAALGEDIVRQIVALNHARVAQQGPQSAIDESATRELIRLIRSHGEAGVIVSAKQLSAGTLACRFGDHVFSLVNAHDPAFDDLGLGNVCRHLMILHAISTGARHFHLMGGNWPGKRATLAERQPLHHLTVYRTRGAILRDLQGIARHALDAGVFCMHCRVEDQLACAPEGWLSRAVHVWRKLRRRRRALPKVPAAAVRETPVIPNNR